MQSRARRIDNQYLDAVNPDALWQIVFLVRLSWPTSWNFGTKAWAYG